MQRSPLVLVENVQLTNAYATYFTATAFTTISSNLFNNTTGTPATVSVSIVPAAGTQGVANEILTNVSIPASGSPPTISNALNGQTLNTGETLQIKCSANTAITPRISGYLTTL
jgi:hypothetical protein